jgi:protein involved in ribonucleotide reduction
MRIIFFSLTGNVRRFVSKLGLPSTELSNTNPFLEVQEPFVLIVPSYDKGVTDILWDFMETADNQSFCKGVVGSGNLNFDSLYVFTAKDLARDFGVPILGAFEYFGTNRDITHIKGQIYAISDIDCKG